MKVITWEELGRGVRLTEPLAAAVGVFDGLHLGHMRLLDAVRAQDGLSKGVVTFRENPKKVLRPSSFHGDIFTIEQKLEALAGLGLDTCLLIDFSGDFSKLAGRKFLSLLRDRGHLRFLAVGADFRCGYRLDTDAMGIRDYYAECGIETRLLESLQVGGHPVSSSRIRKALCEGRLDDARALLGRDYALDLRGARLSVSGGKLHAKLAGGQVEPARGAYEALLSWNGGGASVAASRGDEGWVIEPAAAPAPEALRLVRLVSRE